VGDVHNRMSGVRRAALPLFLFLAGLALLATRLGQVPSAYDEGLTLVGADRIRLGEVPFRDFWNSHPPGLIWVTAALFRLFGASVLVLRVFDSLIKALLALSVWRWASRLGAGRPAGLAFAAAVLWLGALGIFGYAGCPALLFGLESLALVARSLAWPRPRHARTQLAVAGLAAGAATLFRLDFGFYTIAAGVLTIALAHAPGREGGAGERVMRALRAVALFVGVAAAPVAAALLALLLQGAMLSRLVAALVAYPWFIFPEARRLPLPELSWRTMAFYVPLWVGAVSLMRGVLSLRSGGRDDPGALNWCGLSLLLLASTPQARTRADLVHQLPLVLPSIALAVAWCAGLFRHGPMRRTCAALLLPVFALTYLLDPSVSWRKRLPAAPAYAHGLARAAGVALPQDQAAAIRAVQVLTAPDDFVFVGNGRHDRSVGNDAIFSFLAGRRSPTYYHNMLPGLTTSADVQRTIVSELQACDVRHLVLWTPPARRAEPNASSLAGSAVLDDYIRRTYLPFSTIGQYQVWVRRGADRSNVHTEPSR
jgi:Dolichyl-phosphate-mannose-protein mannosyltransferase